MHNCTYVDETNASFNTENYFRILERRFPSYVQDMSSRSLFLVIIPHPISSEDARLQASVKAHMPKDSPVLFIASTSLSYKNKEKLHHSFEDTITHIRRQLHEKISSYYPRDCIAIYTHARTYDVRSTIDVLVEEAYQAILQLWKNHATMGVLAPCWIHNIWKNMSLPLRDSSVKKLITGLPVINGYACVVGAGPSLNTKILQLLQNHRSKFILIACDTALAPLRYNGLYPDICVVLESQYYNIQDFIPPPHGSIHLLCDITAHPTTMRIFSKKMFFCTEFAPLSFFKRISPVFSKHIPALGSVGVASAYIAMQSDAQDIFFTGLDFAFYKGKSHCVLAPAYTTHMLTHTRCNPWQSAKSHFLHKSIYPLENPYKNIKINKVSDTTLSMYAQKCNNMLKMYTKSYNIRKIYEIHNPQSMLRCVNKTHTMNYYNSMLTVAKPASLKWKEVVIKKDAIRTILTKEVQCASYASDAMTYYRQQNLTPSFELWNTHLDFYACTLFEDTYSIKESLKKGDVAYWKEKKLYEKIQQNAKRVVHDIHTVLKDT